MGEEGRGREGGMQREGGADLQLTLCVLLEQLRGNLDDGIGCLVAYIHPYFLYSPYLYRSLSSLVAW